MFNQTQEATTGALFTINLTSLRLASVYVFADQQGSMQSFHLLQAIRAHRLLVLSVIAWYGHRISPHVLGSTPTG
jgi:hypothetical protein